MLNYFRAFLTGSHAYGIPKPDSDVDLVVLVSPEDMEKLRLLADRDDSHPEDQNYIIAGGVPLRFGKLNLICSDARKYKVWKRGTERLKKMAPVTREFACELFRRLRQAAGFEV